MDDMQLLQAYARNGSEPAFAELVSRRIGLVYSAALRQVGDAHLAGEITQAVFILLAQKAPKISARTLLTGWLFRTTRFAALTQIRAAAKRQQLAKELQMQTDPSPAPPDPQWEQIAPWLDEALAALGEADRQAVLLRYFDRQSLAAVGAALGVSEDTARKRTTRALEKLRRHFSRRGVASTTDIIAGNLATQTVRATPAFLAPLVIAVALTKGATASASTLTLVKGTLKSMNHTQYKMALAVGTAVLLAATTTLLAQHQNPFGGKGIPYNILDDASQFSESFDTNKLHVYFIVSSEKKNIHPADIHLTIQSTNKGVIPVHLGAKGQILDFPHDPDLRRENPPILTDQPKGSVNLGIWCYATMPEELVFPYRRLADIVAEANQGMARANEMIKTGYAGQFPLLKGKVKSLAFVFPASCAGKTVITIESASGRKEYHADHAGRLVFKLDDSLQAENPDVQLSQKPKWVVPASPEKG